MTETSDTDIIPRGKDIKPVFDAIIKIHDYIGDQQQKLSRLHDALCSGILESDISRGKYDGLPLPDQIDREIVDYLKWIQENGSDFQEKEINLKFLRSKFTETILREKPIGKYFLSYIVTYLWVNTYLYESIQLAVRCADRERKNAGIFLLKQMRKFKVKGYFKRPIFSIRRRISNKKLEILREETAKRRRLITLQFPMSVSLVKETVYNLEIECDHPLYLVMDCNRGFSARFIPISDIMAELIDINEYILMPGTRFLTGKRGVYEYKNKNVVDNAYGLHLRIIGFDGRGYEKILQDEPLTDDMEQAKDANALSVVKRHNDMWLSSYLSG